MVSIQQQRLQNGLSRSASTVAITTKKSAATNAMTASDPDLAKQLYKANVKLAIEDRRVGASTKYEELREKFISPDTSAIELCQYLTALSNFVTYVLLPMKLSLDGLRRLYLHRWYEVLSR